MLLLPYYYGIRKVMLLVGRTNNVMDKHEIEKVENVKKFEEYLESLTNDGHIVPAPPPFNELCCIM